MSEPAFDTLDAARRLKAAGIDSEHAEAIVEVMGQSVDQLVTRDHFDAGIAKLGTELHARIDTVQAELCARIGAVESKMESLGTELHARIDTVQAELCARIDAVQAELGARIDAVQAELGARIDSVQAELCARIDSVQAELCVRIGGVESNVQSLEAKVQSLESTVRTEIMRAVLIVLGVLIPAIGLMMAIAEFYSSRGGGA